MASDNDPSRRKHHRSPSDEEAEKSSKRHKHRHHRHHRHHRSKKRDEENKQADYEVVDLPPPPPVAATVAEADANRFGGDDDVEEGEILEEAGELHNEKSDSKYLEVAVSKAENGIVSDSNICDQVKDGGGLHEKVGSNPEVLANGRFGHEHHTDDKRHRRRSRSPLKGMHKRKDYVGADSREADESKSSDRRKSSSGSGEGEHKMLAPSLSHDRYSDKDDRRNRSMSREPIRERSRSRSIMDEEALLKRRHDREMPESDTDDDGRTKNSKDRRHSSRDVGRSTEMEHGTNHNIYLGEEYRHYSGDARDAERGKKRGKDSEHKRDNDSEKIRDGGLDRDRRREKEKERSRDKDVDWDHRREKERERSWEIEFDRGGRREIERERTRDRDWRSEKELDAERRRKKQRDESRERDGEVERRRQRDRDTSRDKYTARVSERERDRDREREKDRYRYRDSVRDRDQETEREKERHGRNDRSRGDKGRDIENDSGKVHNSSIDSSDQNQDKPKRFEDDYEDDDFEEAISFRLDEEEDLNKIKEESRKRRQDILAKHKNKELQQQIESHAADMVKDTPVEGPGQLVSSANVGPENVDDMFAPFFVGKSPFQNGTQDSVRASAVSGLGEGSPKSEGSDEKYCDDIFGETPVGVRKFGKGDGLPIMRSALHDNWDDAEGYYSYRFGEILDGRYEIVAAHGKGVFSTVVRAKDLKASKEEPEEVAIKIIRNNETMRKAGDLEVSILKKLAGADPENKLHCVRFLSSFKYRNHLCLVFESLHMNLREVLKKFGRNIGLKLTAVRVYAKQLFIALKHLRNNGVLHSDIKPDNMLVNEAKNVLKLCDFGNAMFSGKNEVTPYLVSRFYRAPEIILGLQYDHPMDMWSVGCCLYELYTGKVLFPGPSNNDMLRLHMELKGPFPKKMLKKGAFVDQHFDHDLNFHATEEDPVTKKTVKRLIVNMKQKDIGSIITSSPGEDPKMSADFKDLLERIFVLDPEKRLTVKAALAHSFITGK